MLPPRKRQARVPRHRKDRDTRAWAMRAIFLLGAALFLFPMVADAINARTQTYAISSYEDEVAGLSAAQKRALLQSAVAHNQQLAAATPQLADPFPAGDTAAGSAEAPFSHVDLRTLDKAIGHLEIPRLALHLPIFEGTGALVLERGVGHIPNSSLPVGGQTTHAVLTAHRGQPTATLFRNLDKLQLGDQFLVHSLGETLAYRVTAIDVVTPADFQKLRIEPGRDLVTLVTCTPYMINSHRLLVTGERVPYQPAAETAVIPRATQFWLREWGPWIAGLAAAAALLTAARWRRRLHSTDPDPQ